MLHNGYILVGFQFYHVFLIFFLQIDGRKNEEVDKNTFNIAQLININENTFYTLTSLELQSGGIYYVWVIGEERTVFGIIPPQ